MKVFLFHLMPYAYVDPDYDKEYDTCWVTYPNTKFDPKKGHELYNRYLDELEYAEELGFDGVCVNEHHQNAYGLMPSPVVMASALASKTDRVKIAILGNAFGIRDHPQTLAEEHAMIDCITGGRLISGMVRGLGAEYYSLGANPAFSHERFHEAHDLVIRAWTQDGPFAFEGKHYHFDYVNTWPRPFQQPHPPIWVPSQGSSETIEWAAHLIENTLICRLIRRSKMLCGFTTHIVMRRTATAMLRPLINWVGRRPSTLVKPTSRQLMRFGRTLSYFLINYCDIRSRCCCHRATCRLNLTSVFLKQSPASYQLIPSSRLWSVM